MYFDTHEAPRYHARPTAPRCSLATVSKPRVWLAAYLRDWSFDITAKAIVKHLSDRFDFRIAYSSEIEALNIGAGGPMIDWAADCYVDLWWHGTIHYTLGRKVLKQISSHRWKQLKWGKLKPSRVLSTYADDVGAIAVPSRRLLDIFREVDAGERGDLPPRQFVLAQKGVDPKMFTDYGERFSDGVLRVGWAGAVDAPDKHVSDLIAADPYLFVAGGTSPTAREMMSTMRNARARDYPEMPAFYNHLDVIACASDAEGDPRPLIEGMACGCFPVTVDVGIVPELVTHLYNGYVIPAEERGPAAFAEAFAWCRDHRSYVRDAGHFNAETMRETRTWEAVAHTWEHAINVAIDRGAAGVGPTRFSSPTAAPSDAYTGAPAAE